jgi:peptidoglycan hydrolase CwlO-like protein
MPEVATGSFAVSSEEERYLRGAFRRFVLPYLIAIGAAVIVVVWVTLTLALSGDSEASEEQASARVAVEAVYAEITALRKEFADTIMRVDGLDRSLGGTAKKLTTLEQRVQQPAPKSGADASQVAALERTLEETQKRLELLEEQVRDSGVRFPAALDPPAGLR